jgi:hypothetical protein
MKFDLNKTIEILERTPNVLKSILLGVSEEWTLENEGVNTWSPFDILGHLILGEETDWVTRTQIILSSKKDKSFVPFNMTLHLENSKGKTIKDLLDQFEQLRFKNLETIKSLRISNKNLNLEGMHPEFGKVTLKELLATWTVHDLGHIAQIARVMAKQYKQEVGPWAVYLGVLK